MKYEQLGQILLEKFGADACQNGYGTTEPYWVGYYGVKFRDINRDGTIN
jgi:hypothetical protein